MESQLKETIRIVRVPSEKKVSFVAYNVSIETLQKIASFTQAIKGNFEIGIYQSQDRTKTTINVIGADQHVIGSILSLFFGDVAVETVEGIIPIREKILPPEVEADTSEMEAVNLTNQRKRAEKSTALRDKLNKALWEKYDETNPIGFFKYIEKLKCNPKYQKDPEIMATFCDAVIKLTKIFEGLEIKHQKNFVYVGRRCPEFAPICIKIIEAKGIARKEDIHVNEKKYDEMIFTALTRCDADDMSDILNLLYRSMRNSI